MTIEDVKKLIASDEGETVEVKESTGQRGDACETLCAFLNKSGGTVVFGVTRKGRLTGQLMADTTKRDLFEAFQKFEPAADIEVEYVPVDDVHTAIVCRVDKGNCRPYVYGGRPYKRVQSSTTVMSQEEYEQMLSERGGFRSDWEARVNPRLTLDELDLDEVKKTARMAIEVGRLDSEVDADDAPTLLKKFKVMHGGCLTNGAAVLFGNDELFGYPQCEIKMARFKGSGKNEFGDERREEGNVFKLLNAAMRFCFKHLNLSAKVVGGQIERVERLEIPPEALREAILNALVHRQYSKNGSVSLAIYDDRLELTSPGGFPPGKTIEQILGEHESEPRNQQIAHVLYLRKTIETWGRGFGRIRSECEAAGCPCPRVEETGGNVRLTFSRLREVSQKDLKFSQKPKEVGQNVDEVSQKAVRTIAAVLPALRSDSRKNVEKVLLAIGLDDKVTIQNIARQASVSPATVKNAQVLLKEVGVLYRVGGDRAGHWLVSWKE